MGGIGPFGYGSVGGIKMGKIGGLKYGSIGGLYGNKFLGAANPNDGWMENDSNYEQNVNNFVGMELPETHMQMQHFNEQHPNKLRWANDDMVSKQRSWYDDSVDGRYANEMPQQFHQMDNNVYMVGEPQPHHDDAPMPPIMGAPMMFDDDNGAERMQGLMSEKMEQYIDEPVNLMQHQQPAVDSNVLANMQQQQQQQNYNQYMVIF